MRSKPRPPPRARLCASPSRRRAATAGRTPGNLASSDRSEGDDRSGCSAAASSSLRSMSPSRDWRSCRRRRCSCCCCGGGSGSGSAGADGADDGRDASAAPLELARPRDAAGRELLPRCTRARRRRTSVRHPSRAPAIAPAPSSSEVSTRAVVVAPPRADGLVSGTAVGGTSVVACCCCCWSGWSRGAGALGGGAGGGGGGGDGGGGLGLGG